MFRRCAMVSTSILAVGVLLQSLASPNARARAATLYVGDETSNGAIYQYSDSGARSTFATGLDPTGLAFDAHGNLFAATHSPTQGVIYKYTPTGTPSVFATGLNLPEGLAFDSGGNLFEADDNSGTIFEFAPSGIKTTFATGLGIPVGLAFAANGDLFASDVRGNIYALAPDGTQTTFASGLTHPCGLAFDSQGNLFVAEGTGGAGHIYWYAPGGIRSTLWSGFGDPFGLAFDASGNLFETDVLNQAVYEFDQQGNRSTFATGLQTPEHLVFAPVPEPSAVALLGIGAISLLGCAWRRRTIIHLPRGVAAVFRRYAMAMGVLSLLLSIAFGNAWGDPTSAPAPMFGLNPANTNVSSYVGISTNPRILWQTPHDAVSIDSPALVLDSRGILYSQNDSPVWAATGQPVSFLTMPFGRSGTPAIDAAGNIYHWEGEYMRAYSPDGSFLWSGAQTSNSDGISPKIGYDGTIYAIDSPASVMYVYSPNGTEKWQVQGYNASTPPAIDGNGNVYLSGGYATGGYYTSYDANGNLRWKSSWNEGWNFGSVILGPDGYLYSSEDYGTKVYVRDPNTGAIVRQQANLYGGIQAIGPDGTLYSASYQTVEATDPFGVIKWRATVPSTMYMSDLVVDAAGQVFCTTEENQIMAFSNSGIELWSLQLPTGNWQSLPPVIGPDGTIYVLDGGSLFAIVPEPGSIVLVVAGGLCLLAYAWRRRRA